MQGPLTPFFWRMKPGLSVPRHAFSVWIDLDSVRGLVDRGEAALQPIFPIVVTGVGVRVWQESKQQAPST